MEKVRVDFGSATQKEAEIFHLGIEKMINRAAFWNRDWGVFYHTKYQDVNPSPVFLNGEYVFTVRDGETEYIFPYADMKRAIRKFRDNLNKSASI